MDIGVVVNQLLGKCFAGYYLKFSFVPFLDYGLDQVYMCHINCIFQISLNSLQYSQDTTIYFENGQDSLELLPFGVEELAVEKLIVGSFLQAVDHS